MSERETSRGFAHKDHDVDERGIAEKRVDGLDRRERVGIEEGGVDY